MKLTIKQRRHRGEENNFCLMVTFDHKLMSLGGRTSRHRETGFLSREPKGRGSWRKEEGNWAWASKASTRVAGRSAFILHSVANMRWPLEVRPCRLTCLFIPPANGLGVLTVCQLFPRGRPSHHTKPQPWAPAGSHAARRVLAAARWRSAPANGPRHGGSPLRLRRRRSGRRRGSRRRLCDFGFDLPGDELIPLYNRLRGDRKMAARYLRRHGDHRARAGHGPGKIQPLWRRVSLTAGTSGGGLGSVVPAAMLWQRGPWARTRTPGHSQSPQTAAGPVSLSSTLGTGRTAVGLFLTANVQPRVCTTEARARPETGPSFRASLGTRGSPGCTLPHRSVRVPKACATGSNAGYCVHPVWSEACT